MDESKNQGRKERLFYAIAQELPRCIDNYLLKAGSPSQIAGFTFDIFLTGEDGSIISDKLHVMLASDRVAGFYHRLVGLSQDQLERIHQILSE